MLTHGRQHLRGVAVLPLHEAEIEIWEETCIGFAALVPCRQDVVTRLQDPTFPERMDPWVPATSTLSRTQFAKGPVVVLAKK